MKKKWMISLLILSFIATSCNPLSPSNSMSTDKKNEPGNIKNQVDRHQAQTAIDGTEKKAVENAVYGVMNAFRNLGERYGWDNEDNPADFNILRPELLKYATERYTDSYLKDIADEYYCRCDARFFYYPDFDVRFRLMEKTDKKMVVSTVEMYNELEQEAYVVYYTLLKENGVWKLDHVEGKTHLEEPLNLTTEEIKRYVASSENIKMEFIGEGYDKNRKVYLIRYVDDDSLVGIFADTSEYLNEIPPELIPEPYRSPAHNIEGTYSWNIPSTKSELNISNVENGTFHFDLFVVSGNSVGELEGSAVLDGNKAIYKDAESGCQLTFDINKDFIMVSESSECLYWHGAGVSFDGTYYRRKE
ncbi:hypothetical protein UM396_07165 [Geobacillus subterraneus]|uniref:hypothetical protein n=1 Tax=Geobacillus subterraneus TaxID=129338 RepID=UPI002AC926D1|nr:hypothetical protein [Geobacillus subterraneus]WPZ19676.1 hypothetical protein UM396_07165 [Geobacillus subterraneus]